MTLVQTQKVTSFPIVLLGRSYWGGLLTWIRDVVLADGKISDKDLALLQVTDDVDEAVAIVTAAQREHGGGPGSGVSPVEPHVPE